MLSEVSFRQLNESLLSELVARGYDGQADHADEVNHQTDFLIAQGGEKRKVAVKVLELVTRCRAINPNMISFTKEFLERMSILFSKEFLLASLAFPIKHVGAEIHMVMANPLDNELVNTLACMAGSEVIPYCGATTDIRAAIDELYLPASSGLGPNSAEESEKGQDIEQVVKQATNAVADYFNNSKSDDFLALASNPFLILLVRLILTDVLEKSISDLHFETEKNYFRLRVRQDGVLRQVWRFEKPLGRAIIARIKVLCGLPLSEVAKPLDGRITQSLVLGREMDIRVSILRSAHGEKAVLRILDRGKDQLSFEDLKLSEFASVRIKEAMQRPNGMILVTGPTGSGKTTTLYAILNELNDEGVNISTAEDPVEYELDGATQVSCTETGTTFAEALKSFLRQDPDIIMVGEIRDNETADIATKAALTGHLMLSTLHTNDAASAITRLLNIGVAPYVIAACNLTVVAQRLVRKICDSCKESYSPSEVELKNVDVSVEVLDGRDFCIGRGCERCYGTGYRGRMGVLEVLTVNVELEKLIASGASAGELHACAVKNGMQTMRQSAQQKLLAGTTSVEEVLRVTADD